MNIRKLIATLLVGGALAVAVPAAALAGPVKGGCVRVHGRGALQHAQVQIGYCP